MSKKTEKLVRKLCEEVEEEGGTLICTYSLDDGGNAHQNATGSPGIILAMLAVAIESVSEDAGEDPEDVAHRIYISIREHKKSITKSLDDMARGPLS